MALAVAEGIDAIQEYLGKDAADLPWGAKIEKEGVMDLITVDAVCRKVDKALADQRNGA